MMFSIAHFFELIIKSRDNTVTAFLFVTFTLQSLSGGMSNFDSSRTFSNMGRQGVKVFAPRSFRLG